MKNHTLELGDILYSSWGYNQTNIDFYQVTKLIGKSMVEIRRLNTESSDEISFMTALKTPIKDNFEENPHLSKTLRRKVSKFNYRDEVIEYVRYEINVRCIKWDGEPKRYSWYA